MGSTAGWRALAPVYRRATQIKASLSTLSSDYKKAFEALKCS
jgi:hypothetical protein